jgi:hypothetical protein
MPAIALIELDAGMDDWAPAASVEPKIAAAATIGRSASFAMGTSGRWPRRRPSNGSATGLDWAARDAVRC